MTSSRIGRNCLWQLDNNGYTSIWNMISGGGAAIVNSLEIAIAYLVFPIAAQLFTLIYIFWGAVLYAVGPLVLALAPSRMINGTAKFYAQNLIVWNCWAVLYAVFACLITAVNGKDLTTSPFFSGSDRGCADAGLDWADQHHLLDLHPAHPDDCHVRPERRIRRRRGCLMSLISVGTQVTQAATSAAKAAEPERVARAEQATRALPKEDPAEAPTNLVRLIPHAAARHRPIAKPQTRKFSHVRREMKKQEKRSESRSSMRWTARCALCKSLACVRRSYGA